MKVLGVAVVMAFVLAACGQGGGAATVGGGTAAPPAAGGGTAAPPGAHDPRAYQSVPAGDWNTPFPEPVHITAISTQGINWHFVDGDTMQDSPWTRLFADELNVHVEYEWLSLDDYDTRFLMTVAADALPDVFFIPMAVQRTFNELQAAGTLLDLTHAWDNYTSERLRHHEVVDPLTFAVYKVDGRRYALPRMYYGQIDQPWHMWVRKDWHEAEGSPEIRTVADLENLAHAFINNHGANYGFSVDNNMQFLFRTAPMFGAYIGNVHDNAYFWRPDASGRLRPGIAFPEFMVALEYWQRWFAEGLISPEFVAMGPWDRVHEDVVNGVVGIQPWWQWWGSMNGGNIVTLQHEDAYFIPFNLPTVDGARPARGQIFFPNVGIIAAHRDFQNPGAWMKILSMVDHMQFSPDANLTAEQVHYFMADGREHGMGPTLKIIDPNADMLQLIYINEALRTGDASNLFTAGMNHKHNEIQQWLNYRYPPGSVRFFLQLGSPHSAYARSQHLFDNGWVVQNSLWGGPPNEFDQVGPIGDIILEEVMQIVMGINPVSHFESVLEQWYAQGGQIKEDAVNLHFGN